MSWQILDIALVARIVLLTRGVTAVYVWVVMAFFQVFAMAPTGSDLLSWSLINGPECLNLFGYRPYEEVDRGME